MTHYTHHRSQGHCNSVAQNHCWVLFPCLPIKCLLPSVSQETRPLLPQDQGLCSPFFPFTSSGSTTTTPSKPKGEILEAETRGPRQLITKLCAVGLFVCLLLFWDRVSLCSPGWPWTRNPPALAAPHPGAVWFLTAYVTHGNCKKTIRSGGVTQVVEPLPHKCKALSSNCSTTKKKNYKGELNKEKVKSSKFPLPKDTYY
jgi:hypothetical protein